MLIRLTRMHWYVHAHIHARMHMHACTSVDEYTLARIHEQRLPGLRRVTKMYRVKYISNLLECNEKKSPNNTLHCKDNSSGMCSLCLVFQNWYDTANEIIFNQLIVSARVRVRVFVCGTKSVRFTCSGECMCVILPFPP